MNNKTCDNCIEYQPNRHYCPLVDLFMPPDSSCEEFIAKKDEVKDEE